MALTFESTIYDKMMINSNTLFIKIAVLVNKISRKIKERHTLYYAKLERDNLNWRRCRLMQQAKTQYGFISKNSHDFLLFFAKMHIIKHRNNTICVISMPINFKFSWENVGWRPHMIKHEPVLNYVFKAKNTIIQKWGFPETGSLFLCSVLD